MSESPRVTMLSQYGSPTQGVSPYSDMLADQLTEKISHFKTATYRAAYPEFNSPPHPAKQLHNGVHYLNPFSWSNFCKKSQKITHIQYWTSFGAFYLYFIVRKLRKLGKLSIITVHNPAPHESIPLARIFEHQLLKAADHIITHTESGKQQLIEKYAISSAKISVIPHGVQIHKEERIENTTDQHNRKYLLAAGNIRPYKGTDILIDAWKLISDKHPDYELIIAGRLWGAGGSILGNMAAKLLGTKGFSEKIALKLNNQEDYNIKTLFEFLSDEKLEELIKNASMCLFPYRKFSGQSGIASKSASHGTPIVCSNQEGLIQLCIDSSFVINELTARKIASVIEEKIHAISEETRVDQRKKIQKLSWQNIADMHIETYHYVACKYD